eukprot:CAMPEP_0185790494 /NCGR_PEP_ID=MMETSP1174-20130828/156674_1 /TAXON_ID=35687 /ORGANISM="Dictyocha speculum, Strain CCMP1381" /LENGTH=144 /DNA_ID=CAMNT_0028485215 /DNA_START=1 /DNA_END=432 /DNA_ORIENTATION=-
MEEMKALGVRSVLLASGTLAPLDSFATELHLPFQVRLENPHVIDASKQVLVQVVSRGVTNGVLCSNFANRESEAYKFELGSTLANFARVVRGGMLVFFPSYPALDSAVASWKQSKIWGRLTCLKPAFVEPRGGSALRPIMDDFE